MKRPGDLFRRVMAVVVAATAPLPAGAQTPPPQAPCPLDPYPASRTWLFLGWETGTTQGFDLSVDGHDRPSEGANFYFGFRGGLAYTPAEGAVGVIGLARLGSWYSSWSVDKGEERIRYDLAAGPAVRFGGVEGRPRSAWHLAMPIGLSIAKVSAGPGRAVQESYSTGYGPNLGVMAGVDVAGVHHGATFDLSWTGHVTWIRHDATLAAAPHTVVREDERYIDHVLALTIGYVYWL